MSTPVTIHDTIWTGSTAKALRAHGNIVRDVQIYLLTCPEKNPFGLFIIEPHVLRGRLDGTEKDFRKALAVLSSPEINFCAWEEESGWTWVIEMARFQFSAPLRGSDYRNLAIKKWYRTAPASPYIGAWYDRYVHDFHLDKEPQAVERRSPKSSFPPTAALAIEGASKPLCTIRTSPEVFVLQPEVQESLLPVPVEDRVLPPAERLVAFEAFWKLYPRGEQKKDAREYFAAMKLTPRMLEHMTTALRAQAASTKWRREPDFIPRMINWLKKERWDDRVDEEQPVLNERTTRALSAAERFGQRNGDGHDEEP